MKNFLLFLSAVALSLSAFAAKPHSKANLRVDYSYRAASPYLDSIEYGGKPEIFMLQVAPDESRFFSIKTEFHDSIAATPGGADLINKMQMDALENSGGIQRNAAGEIISITVRKDAFEGVPMRGEAINVYKYPEQMSMMVFDRLSGRDDDYSVYEVPMDDLEWEPGDSTRLILGYECQNAHALYHGRKWTAWYAPDIAVSEGPWQLFGLPGLILRAESDGAEYIFEATSVSECNEQIKDMPGNPDVEKTSRLDFLRQKHELIESPGKAFGIVSKKEPIFHDFKETDYR